MKALIPVAGMGKKLRPHTYTQPKPLVPVAGKPIISFIIDELVAVGFDDFIFVTGYLGEKIRHYVEKRYPDLKKTFVHQPKREGLGHAIWMCQEALEDSEEVFIVLGDTVFDADLQIMLNSPNSSLGVKKVEDPRNFGVAEIDENNFVKRLVEKPKIPKSNLAMVGLYKIKDTPLLMECLEQLITEEKRTLGEYQLTDALMMMIERGARFEINKVANWFDCGKKEMLLETNSLLLKKRQYQQKGNYEEHEGCIIIPPVSIGEGCKISNSIIGPNVSIGEHCTIQSTIITNSIIGDYVFMSEVVMNRSIIGSDASIKGLSQSLNIGDNTEIDFN